MNKIYKAQPSPRGNVADVRDTAIVARSTYCTDLKKKKSPLMAKPGGGFIHQTSFHCTTIKVSFCSAWFHFISRSCRFLRLYKWTEAVFWSLKSHCVSRLLLIAGWMSWLADFKGSINWFHESQSKQTDGDEEKIEQVTFTLLSFHSSYIYFFHSLFNLLSINYFIPSYWNCLLT